MFLPDQTRGPVTISKIQYLPKSSHETFCFGAFIAVNGMSSPVNNEGTGGQNHVHDREVWDALTAYAKTLPKIKDPYSGDLYEMDADVLISEMIGDAIKSREHEKMRKRGFTHYMTDGGLRAYYTKHAPTQAEIEKLFRAQAPNVTVTAL